MHVILKHALTTINITDKESKKSCDFETADLCGWMQDDSDSSYFDWTRTTAAEMTHSQGTGPTSDHTFPDKETGLTTDLHNHYNNIMVFHFDFCFC